METQQKIVTIAILSKVGRSLDYQVPEDMHVCIGDLVEVPLGKKTCEGVVLAYSQTVPEGIKMKYVERVVHAQLCTEGFLKFILWFASYTVNDVGMALKMAVNSKNKAKEVAPPALYKLGHRDTIATTAARKKVFDLLESASNALTVTDIAERASVSRAVVNTMVKAGALTESFRCPKPEAQKVLASVTMNVQLSDSQQHAADIITKPIQADEFDVVLLDGVTGSGKTEVYLKAIEAAINQGKQALVMLPEIILTSQMLKRFEERLGIKPVLWHSAITPAKRRDAWNDVVSGKAQLVVGARSSLFLPFKHLGLVIVDEEHDGSYKQEEGVIYNARDAAVVRGKFESFPVVLASATPSVESFYNVKQGKYNHAVLASRFGGAVMPEVQLIDMRKEKLPATQWLSHTLKLEIAQTIEKKQQVALFLNRKGYAPLSLCRKCGHRFDCSNCSSWLVTHQALGKRLCHHCGYEEPIVTKCPSCGAEDEIAACGPGVERLYEEAKEAFPAANIMVLSADEVSTANKAKELIAKIVDGDVDIIIGTQIIAKGHHFPRLTLVGVVDADFGLMGGDLRASEKTFQLLHQVAGRAGREKDAGKVIMQSHMPENIVIQALKENDRDALFEHELSSREICEMPPFARLAGVIVSDHVQTRAAQAAAQLAAAAPPSDKVMVMGPIQAPMFQLRGKYRYRLLVKAGRTINLSKWVASWLSQVKMPSTVAVKADIDPYNFM